MLENKSMQNAIKEELNKHNLRVTKQRSSILLVLRNHHTPLTIDQIIEKADVEMDLSTVYRILDAFVENKLVNRTVLQEPNSAVYDYNRNIHRHHLICTECMEITVVKDCPLGTYEEEVEEETGFKVTHHQLELYGICKKCRQG